MRLAALSVLFLCAGLTVAEPVTAADDAPRVRVASVELPAKRDGGRDLRHALGAEPEAAAATSLATGLATTELVSLADDGQDAELLLAVRLEGCRTRPDDRSDLGGATSLVEVRATAVWTWTRAGMSVAEGRTERQLLHEQPGRIDTSALNLAWQDLLTEVGRAIAIETGASGAFRHTEAR